MHTIEARGRRFRVDVRSGLATHTPLLLMNGIGASLETFQGFIDVLDPDIEVIRFDVPGIGGSPTPPRLYRLPGLARQIGSMLDVLGYGQVDVLGISWGGGLAQQFAFTRADRCRRLVLVATGTGSVMVPGSPRTLAKMITPRRYRDRTYLRTIAGDLYGGAARVDAAELTTLLDGYGHGGQLRGYSLQLLAACGWTSLGILPLLRQPTLVLAGDDDPIVPAVNGKIIAGLVRNARLHVYPGGHIDLVAYPTLLTGVIEGFLV
jgi:poly(3-hydroxyalkanoate) depolymerase